MATALTPLANLTLGGAAATVTFSSISSSYRDLYLVINAGVTSSYSSIFTQFNSDTGANYSTVTMYGDAASTGSTNNSGQTFGKLQNYGFVSSSVKPTLISHVMDYSATDKHKTVLTRSNDAADMTEATVVRWASTSAITSMVVYPSAGNFASGSTFALYGVTS